jgi:hypothetical protein
VATLQFSLVSAVFAQQNQMSAVFVQQIVCSALDFSPASFSRLAADLVIVGATCDVGIRHATGPNEMSKWWCQ